MQGIPTPFSVTRFKNDNVIKQYYVTKVVYNQNLPGDFWDPDAVAAR